MAIWLKQSTAVGIKLGPFVSSVDGFTPQTSLSVNQSDVRLAKNDGDWAQKNESTSAVHEENGWYRVLLDATDTDTLGALIVAVNEMGALPVWREFMVMEGISVAAAVWNEVAADHQAAGSFGATIGDRSASVLDASLHELAVGINSTTSDMFAAVLQTADAVWDEATVDHQTEGSFGEAVAPPATRKDEKR